MKFGSVDIGLVTIGRTNWIKLASVAPLTTISLPTV